MRKFISILILGIVFVFGCAGAYAQSIRQPYDVIPDDEICPVSDSGVVLSNQIAKWNGKSWSALGTGFDGDIYAIAVRGSNVYVGGHFTIAGGVKANRIAKWDGLSWSALGSGVDGEVYAIAVSGSNVYVGGYFTAAGGVNANYIAKWNGISWSALGSGVDGEVRALAASGSNLYVGGHFTTAGRVCTKYIAKWNGKSWSTLGGGLGLLYNSEDSNRTVINAIAISGNDVYVGGTFSTYISKYVLSTRGYNMYGQIIPYLVTGGVYARNIAKWDGKSWSTLGRVKPPDSKLVYSIRHWDEGDKSASIGVGNQDEGVYAIAISGRSVYVGGDFTIDNRVRAKNIAKWNGTSWSAVGSGVDGKVLAIMANGSSVYVGGDFTTAGGVSTPYIANWNGTSWSALPGGADGIANAIAVSDSNVYLVGNFGNNGPEKSRHAMRKDQIIKEIVERVSNSRVVNYSLWSIGVTSTTSFTKDLNFYDKYHPQGHWYAHDGQEASEIKDYFVNKGMEEVVGQGITDATVVFIK